VYDQVPFIFTDKQRCARHGYGDRIPVGRRWVSGQISDFLSATRIDAQSKLSWFALAVWSTLHSKPPNRAIAAHV
jgi:hypothetical protein